MKRPAIAFFLVTSSTSACFVDATGLGDGPGAGAGEQTTSTGDTTTDGGPGPTTSVGGGGVGGAGGSGVTTTGGGGGEGPTGCTVDGAINPNEACEDGNLTAGDGCDPVCQLEATCGNGMAEGGEPCDDGTVCDASCLGSCQGGTLLTAGQTVSGSTNGGIGAFQSCAFESTGAMAVYRIETAPHPEGVVVYVSDAGTSFDPMLWLARDCQDVWGCIEFWSTDADVAGLVTGILPPSTKLIAGVADKEANEPSFEIYYRTFRYFDEFQTDPTGWTLGEWDSDGSNLTTWYDGPGAADSPDIYVGGIQTIRVAFPYEISNTAGAQVSASFDGGAFSVVKTLPAASNPNFDPMDGSFTLQRPAGTSRLRLRFEYLGNQEGIIIARLEVGADVPAPTF